MRIEENANARFDFAEKERKREEEKEIRRERNRENGERALEVYEKVLEEKGLGEEVFEDDLKDFEVDGDRYYRDKNYREALNKIVLGVSKMKEKAPEATGDAKRDDRGEGGYEEGLDEEGAQEGSEEGDFEGEASENLEVSENNEISEDFGVSEISEGEKAEIRELSDEEINKELYLAREEAKREMRENEGDGGTIKKIEQEMEEENLEIQDELFDLIYRNAERGATEDLINENVGGDTERVENRETLEDEVLEGVSGKGKECWDRIVGAEIEKIFFQLGRERNFVEKFGLRREDFGEEMLREYDPSKDAAIGEGNQYWLLKDGGIKGETVEGKLTNLEEKIQDSWRAAELYAGAFGARGMGGMRVRELIPRGKEFEENRDNDFRYEVAKAVKEGIDPEKVSEFAPVEGTFLMEYMDRDFRTDEVEFSEGIVDITELARKSGKGYRDGVYLSIERGIGEETKENIARMLGTTLTEIRKKQGSMAIREKDGSIGVYYPATEVEREAARERQRAEDEKRKEGETFGRANKDMENLLGKVLGW